MLKESPPYQKIKDSTLPPAEKKMKKNISQKTPPSRSRKPPDKNDFRKENFPPFKKYENPPTAKV